MLDRARYRVSLQLPYHSDPAGYTDGYRQDCSGFTAYAWGAPTPGYGTSEMERFGAFRIDWNDLQPGDGVNNPLSGSAGHVMIFSRWINDGDRNVFEAMEHTGSGERIFNHSRGELQGSYHPVRWNGVDVRKPYGIINDTWLQGNNQAVMGESVNDEFSTDPAGSGRFRDFQQGMIVWKSGAAGASMIHGAIFTYYREHGSETRFGFPLGDEADEAGGKVQRFERGTLHWSAAGGVREG